MSKWKITLVSLFLTVGLVGLVLVLNIFNDTFVMVQSAMFSIPSPIFGFSWEAIVGALEVAILVLLQCNWAETCPLCNMQEWCRSIAPSCCQ